MKINNILKYFRNQPLLIALFINISLFLLVYFILQPTFNTVDDVHMLLEVSGVLSNAKPVEYMIYSNILIGKILKFLYCNFNTVSWYELYLNALLFTSFTAFLYLFLQKIRNWCIAIVSYLSFFITAGVFIIMNLQFTLTASITTFAGIALLFSTQKTPNSRINLIALLLIITGSLVRFHSFVLAVVVCIPLILYRFRFVKKMPCIDFSTRIKPIIILITAICISYSLYSLNYYIYSKTNGYSDFYKFNTAKVKINDFHFLEKTPKVLKNKKLTECNWTLNDYNMFTSWFFYKNDIYTPQKISKLVAGIQIDKRFNINTFFKIIFSILLKDKKVFWAICVSFIFGLSFFEKWSQWICLITCYAISILLFVYIANQMKEAPFRVYFAVFMFLAMCPVFIFIETQTKSISIRIKTLALLTISILLNYLSVVTIIKDSKYNKMQSRMIQLVIKDLDKNNVYVNWRNALKIKNIEPFTVSKTLRNLKLISGPAFCFAESNIQRISSYGITDVFEALLSKDKVLLFSPTTDFNMLQKYYKEHNSCEIQINQLYSSHNTMIVKIVPSKKK